MTTIVTRSGKGSPISATENDANLNNLNNDKVETSNNLSDLASATTARTNLGLGTAATTSADAYVGKTSTTGSGALPSGTEAQRDGSPASGYIRFNSDSGSFEGYDGSAWGSIGGGASAGGATASGSAPSYSARAWVNFNGTGTVAIRDSGNVSSITDNGVGQYQVNFTTAMPDANYSCSGSGNDNQALISTFGGTYSTTTARVYVVASSTGGTYDFSRICMIYLR